MQQATTQAAVERLLTAPDAGMDTALESLIASVNEHDTYTGGHSIRVASFAAAIGRAMELEEPQIGLLSEAGLVHDIGKVAIPESILRKASPLTDEEFHLVSLHPILGASILSRIAGMEQMVSVVLYHHERWDGQGYPSRLSGVDIPLESRIILVADTYDALTTQRPFGKVMSPSAALTEISLCAGKQFDPLVCDALARAYALGTLVGETPRKPVHSLVL